MRSYVLALLILFFPASLQSQQVQQRANPAEPCHNQKKWTIPDDYYFAVLAAIKPPGLGRSLVRIVFGGEIKIVLWTDGEKFQLSTDTFDLPQKSIGKFLLDLDRSCQLPPDPEDAAALIKFNWENKQLSAAQFAQFHDGFATALAQYVAKIQVRYRPLMSRGMIGSYLDAVNYKIIYDNTYEHNEVNAWDVPENNALNPMAAWVHELQKFAAQTFHRPFGRESKE